jgi:transcriptional regulator with XRE-family HTH domain
MASFKAKYTEAERKAFGQLLRQLMTDKGVTGADLARRANKYISSGKGMDRSMISWYVNGRSVPTPVSLSAIAKVLDVDPQLMLPRAHSQKPGEAAGPVGPTSNQDVRMSLESGNMMHLMLNRRLPAEVGWKIIELIKELPR